MAFKKKNTTKEQLELISLIDMILILLVFFLVASFVMQLEDQESGLYMPTPENERGRAQIVMQLMEDGRTFWLDENAADEVANYRSRYSYLPEPGLSRKVFSLLISANTYSYGKINEKLSGLKLRAKDNPDENFFVLIRCPDALPYERVINVIAQLTDLVLPNLTYGCVGGHLNDMLELRNITIKTRRDNFGNRRENIIIDF
ncbi:biopolymer transporter ExbD [bacterium]|nr:biopolymer transporter ExbD [bacterium]